MAAVLKMQEQATLFEDAADNTEAEAVKTETEFEKKYLVDAGAATFEQIPAGIGEGDYELTELAQRYFAFNGQKYRLRKTGTGDKVKYTLNTKTGKKPFRQESKRALEEGPFRLLWEGILGTGHTIEKTRYRIPASFTDNKGKERRVTIELDIFAGKLTGLVLAEVEFAGDEQEAGAAMEAFNQQKPDWMAVDVTMQFGFGNNALSQVASLEQVQQKMLIRALAGPGRRVVRGCARVIRIRTQKVCREKH